MERMEKKIYEFTNDGNSCVIYDAKPPRYWFNYLWNENGYCAQVSQNGHGRSYYLNERADMCMINNNDARYFYIRDDEMNKSWNIGAAPLNEQVESYQCEHSIGFSRLQSECQGIESSWRIFVPQTGFQEVWTFRLRNKSDRARMLSTFSAVTFELEGFSYPRYYEMYRCLETSFDRELNGIYCRSAHPFAPHKRYNAYLASSEPVYAYDGDLARFCGAAGSVTKLDASAYALFQRPDVVVNGGDCTNSEAALLFLAVCCSISSYCSRARQRKSGWSSASVNLWMRQERQLKCMRMLSVRKVPVRRPWSIIWTNTVPCPSPHRTAKSIIL